MSVKVAINGFGRIGRNVLRAIAESGRRDIEVVAINDLGPVETNAHLLRFDSVHGRFPGVVKVDGDTIDIGSGPIKVTAIRDPAELPHGALGVDIALECTGIFTKRDKAALHLAAGAKRVLVSAPAEGADLTVVYGVNHQKLTADHVVVSIADTGCGIPKENLALLCDPFFTTKDVGSGTGLGLSIVADIVRSHGGKLEIDSRPGEGATFSVILPIRQPEKPRDAVADDAGVDQILAEAV